VEALPASLQKTLREGWFTKKISEQKSASAIWGQSSINAERHLPRDRVGVMTDTESKTAQLSHQNQRKNAISNMRVSTSFNRALRLALVSSNVGEAFVTLMTRHPVVKTSFV
jgi:hypothetical protein